MAMTLHNRYLRYHSLGIVNTSIQDFILNFKVRQILIFYHFTPKSKSESRKKQPTGAAD
jgi:hypothetical protein